MQLGDLLNAIKIWVENIISSMGYVGLYIVMFLENVFPPIPSEVVFPLAGSLTLDGRFSIFWITIIGMLGSLTGAFLFYGLGKWLGEARVRVIDRKIWKIRAIINKGSRQIILNGLINMMIGLSFSHAWYLLFAA